MVVGLACRALHRIRQGRSSHSDAAVFDWEHGPSRRAWLSAFEARALQAKDATISFARSSGPGGQNVNKVNTKVLARLPLGAHSSVALPPPLIKSLATQSPLYIQATHALQVTSDRYRSQSQNIQDALYKLQAEIVRVASIGLQGETSVEQKKRVEMLQHREREKKRKAKQMRSMTKSNRRAKP